MYRIAEMKDIDGITELRILQQKENYKNDYKVEDKIFSQNTKKFLNDNLNKNIYFFIKELDNKIAAMCGIQLINYLPMYNEGIGLRGYICSVYTREEYRKQGIQTHLLKNAIQFSKDKNIGIIELKTTNPDAVSVYEKVGFKEVKKRMRLELV